MLTSHTPAPLQLRIWPSPTSKDQQPPLEQLGHHHSNQARQDGSRSGGCFKVFYLLQNIGLFLSGVVMFRGPGDWEIQTSRDLPAPHCVSQLRKGSFCGLSQVLANTIQEKFRLSVQARPSPALWMLGEQSPAGVLVAELEEAGGRADLASAPLG